MKHSQLYSQIFVYILTVLLISFIFIYGYNSIQNFKKRAENVACLKFKNDIKGAIDTVIGDFGTTRRKDLELCSGYKQVCFIETFENINDIGNPQSNVVHLDPIVKNSIASNSEKNAFFVNGESFYIGKISVDRDVLCIDAVSNKISLRLEGMGNYVKLSQWS